ncbi:transporter substrate-binding domain-containing protein [Paenibacillus sp. P25]|nr:transporter substrate-binding domain-containing protein [Paenibacillus sp. P25]
MTGMMNKKASVMLAMILSFVLLLLSGCGSTASKDGAGTSQGSKPAAAAATDLPPLPAEVKKRGKLVVGVKVDYPPLGYLDQEGKNTGYEIDVVRKMAEYAFGDPNAVEFVPVNATNRIPYLVSKKIDFISATLGVTEERKKEINFTTTFFDGGAITVVPKGSSIKDIQDLAGKKVIVIKGSTASTFLEKEVPTAEQLKIESNADAFRVLKDKRADAMLHDAVLMSEFVKTSPDYTIVGKQVAMAPMAIGVRKDDPEMLTYLNAAMEKMRKADYFKTLIEKYMPRAGDLDPMQMIPRP